MLDRQDLRDVWGYILLIAPAPIGALIGMRYAVDQTPKGRAVTWLCSSFVGVLGGGIAGERLELTHYEIALATVVAAAVSMELIAGVVTAARAFAGDPLGFTTRALELLGRILPRRGPPGPSA